MTKGIASAGRTNVTKRPRIWKGPWMKNRQEIRNTRKTRIYQFTQKAYKQNKKATVNTIVNGNFSLNHAEQTFPDIEQVESSYVDRLQQGNLKDSIFLKYPETQHNTCYGKFTTEEVTPGLKELKRNSASGNDSITTSDLKRVPVGHITAIMNYWWGVIIPKDVEECRTTL